MESIKRELDLMAQKKAPEFSEAD